MLRRFEDAYPTFSTTPKSTENVTSNTIEFDESYPDDDSTSPKPVSKPVELFNSVLGLQVRWFGNSVTRSGDFLKFLATNLLTKVAQTDWWLLGYFEKDKFM